MTITLRCAATDSTCDLHLYTIALLVQSFFAIQRLFSSLVSCLSATFTNSISLLRIKEEHSFLSAQLILKLIRISPFHSVRLVHLLLKRLFWLKYCRYDVKHYSINQSAPLNQSICLCKSTNQWPFSQRFLRSIMLVGENLRFCSFSQKFLREYLRVKSVVTLRQF